MKNCKYEFIHRFSPFLLDGSHSYPHGSSKRATVINTKQKKGNSTCKHQDYKRLAWPVLGLTLQCQTRN